MTALCDVSTAGHPQGKNGVGVHEREHLERRTFARDLCRNIRSRSPPRSMIERHRDALAVSTKECARAAYTTAFLIVCGTGETEHRTAGNVSNAEPTADRPLAVAHEPRQLPRIAFYLSPTMARGALTRDSQE